MDECLLQPSQAGRITQKQQQRRLKEELGFETPLEKIFAFYLQSFFENGLTENEFDHVFAGIYNGEINFNRT